VSVLAVESWSTPGPPALSGDQRNTCGKERLNQKKNKNIKEKQNFFRPVKVICQNLNVGGWWVLGSVCLIPCALTLLCAATWSSSVISVFALHELLGAFVISGTCLFTV